MVVLIGILFTGAVRVHQRIERMDIQLKSTEVYMYVPSGALLQSFTFGYDQLAADYFWIKALSYFGDHIMSDRNYPWLYHIIDLVTTLDPMHKWPYYFGGVTLSLEAKRVDQSNLIWEKGMRHHPDYWKYPFYLGFNYWYYYNNSAKAASYIDRAARLPNSPSFLKTFAASLYSESGQAQAALRFLEEIRRTIQDPRMIAEIEKRMKELSRGERKKINKAKIL